MVCDRHSRDYRSIRMSERKKTETLTHFAGMSSVGGTQVLFCLATDSYGTLLF